MPVTVFDCKASPRLEAVKSKMGRGRRTISMRLLRGLDFNGPVPRGFDRIVAFALDIDPATIQDRVRQILEE